MAATDTDKEHCNCDYNKAVRVGRLHYTCPSCGQDITMGVMLLQELLQESDCYDD